MNGRLSWSLLFSFATVSVLAISLVSVVDARPQRAQGHARASVNRPPPPHAPRAQRVNAPQRANHVNGNNRVSAGNRVNSGNRNYVNNSRHNVNIDNHRDVDIDVDGRGRYGYDDHYHPIGTAVAVGATVAVTSAVIGAIFTPAQMPSSCVQVMRYNTMYMQCGSTWYQPQYQGSDVTYIVVNAP
jgi:hypothetical protein